MIKSLKVENFRCFRAIEATGLQRINVVVGKNATGKTALLEAVRLAVGGTPTVLWGLNPSRGYFGGVPQPMTRDIFESLWNSYFFNFDSSTSIFTDCSDSNDKHSTLRVSYDARTSEGAITSQPAVPQQAAPTIVPTSFIPRLAFERSGFPGTATLYATALLQGGLNFDQGPELGPVTEFIQSSAMGVNYNPNVTTQLFSQLSLQQRESKVVAAVRDEFEHSLDSLVVLSPTGGQPALYASLGYLKEKLPVTYLSAGIGRFIAMLSAVLLRRKGIVLIDEIENGLSYKSFTALWKYLLAFATENDTQIFVSTHSAEFVRDLLPAMEGHENDFTLLRAERVNGSSGIEVIDGKLLEAAIDQGVEVR
jgi:ABC-type branched-subunit amino acid transport system ATPase component